MGKGDLNQLLSELLQAGQKPDRTLLDRVKAHQQAAVSPLIEMAVAQELHEADSDSPEVWAPLHAIQLLGELGAPEAVAPLLPLFDRPDDDWLAEALLDAFGNIGAPAMSPLRVLLFDRSRDALVRARGAEGLGEIGQRHPKTRSEVVSSLVARLEPSECQTPEDQTVNGFVISALLDLKAVEAAPAVRQAFDEDRVDTSIVDLDHALKELGLPFAARPARSAERAGLPLRLRCTACGHQRAHHVETIYCDVPTQERRQRGEPTPYSEFVIPQRIICPKCGAVDQYELSGMAYLALMAELLKKLAADKAASPGAEADDGALRFIRGLADGREMHPLAARDLYRQKVEAEPNRADLRVRCANVLGFLGYREEAIEHYRAALRLDPANLEAYLNLGWLARAAEDLLEARRMFERVLTLAPSSHLPRQTREDYVAAATEELAEIGGPAGRSGVSRLPAPFTYHEGPVSRGTAAAAPGRSMQAVQKVGRNDPCPCGSGRKYKRCHGR